MSTAPAGLLDKPLNLVARDDEIDAADGRIRAEKLRDASHRDLSGFRNRISVSATTDGRKGDRLQILVATASPSEFR